MGSKIGHICARRLLHGEASSLRRAERPLHVCTSLGCQSLYIYWTHGVKSSILTTWALSHWRTFRRNKHPLGITTHPIKSSFSKFYFHFFLTVEILLWELWSISFCMYLFEVMVLVFVNFTTCYELLLAVFQDGKLKKKFKILCFRKVFFSHFGKLVYSLGRTIIRSSIWR